MRKMPIARCLIAPLLAGMPLSGQQALAAGFAMRVEVRPVTMPYDSHPTLTVYAPGGAQCTALIRYSTGRRAVSLHNATATVPAAGRYAWQWHEETKGKAGTGSVTCSFHGTTQMKAATFVVTH